MRETDELLVLCRYASSSLAISQGAGGNVSIKRPNAGQMWIKASGCRISSVGPGEGYIRMRTPTAVGLSGSVAGQDDSLANKAMSAYMQGLVLDSTNQRPSLETWFHALLGRVVLHTHPIYANAFSCMEGGREVLNALLAECPAYVRYRAPGHLLGAAVHAAIEQHRGTRRTSPSQVLLENHGLITAADTVGEAIESSEQVLQAGRDYFGALGQASFAAGERNPDLETWASRLELAARISSGQEFMARPGRFALLLGGETNRHDTPNALMPDDVICNGLSVLCARAQDSAEGFVLRHHQRLMRAAAIRVRDLGYVFLAPGPAMIEAMEEQLLANLLVRELIGRRGRCRPLPTAEAHSLLAMESEKYRQSVIAAGGGSCRS